MVEVAALIEPEARVEVETTAVLPIEPPEKRLSRRVY
jgi:hypothetical protein